MEFKSLAIGALLPLLGVLTSCQDNMAENSGIQLDENGLATITLSIDTEDVMGTRAEGDPTQEGTYISTGQKVDELIYAIYMKKGDTYELQDYFATANGTVAEPEEQGESQAEPVDGQGDDAGTADENKATGQIVMKDFDATKTTHILLKVDPDETYKIVCWAQSSKCEAYNTDNLASVTVSYAGALNNDETRDAFCGSKDFTGTERNVKVVLRRPFAQINVGTTGADYANTAKIPGGAYYSYSKMEISSAHIADQINVLTGEITQSADMKKDNKPVDLSFGWATIPAWINIEGYTSNTVPSLNPHTVTGDDGKEVKYNEFVWAKGEDFLKVDLDSDHKIKDYLTYYDTKHVTKDAEGKDKTVYLTETFKYLAMSYVLVVEQPAASTVQDENTADDSKGSTVGVTVYFNDQPSDISATASKTKLALVNVPVARNWRTNILGGFHNPKQPHDPNDPNDPDDPNNPDDPDDPDDPDSNDPVDDPSTIFSNTHVDVVVVTNYFGNYTTTDVSGEVEFKSEENDDCPTDEEVKTGHDAEDNVEGDDDDNDEESN